MSYLPQEGLEVLTGEDEEDGGDSEQREVHTHRHHVSANTGAGHEYRVSSCIQNVSLSVLPRFASDWS